MRIDTTKLGGQGDLFGSRQSHSTAVNHYYTQSNTLLQSCTLDTMDILKTSVRALSERLTNHRPKQRSIAGGGNFRCEQMKTPPSCGISLYRADSPAISITEHHLVRPKYRASFYTLCRSFHISRPHSLPPDLPTAVKSSE